MITPATPCLLDRAGIEAHQYARLRALVDTLKSANPFYSARLAGVQIESLRDYRDRVPFTFKHELAQDQIDHPPYGTNLTFPLERYTRFNQTSGTTGSPMRWIDTPESWDWMVECWRRVYIAAEAGPHDRVYFPFSFGPFLGFWVAFEAATRMGALAIPGGGMRTSARLQAILDNQVTILCSTPTYALRLAEVAAAEGFELSGSAVRAIIVAGEPGGSIPATRALIEHRWPGARVVDHHGMTEMGPVSYECPVRRGVVHIIELAYLAEVIDTKTAQPVEPGQAGELVLTNLGRTGSPLLRYRTGDLVRLGPDTRCACGSSEVALDGGILSRTDDMLVIRGVNIYPSAVEQILRSCGVAEFQVETYTDRNLKEMSIRIEAPYANGDGANAAARVQTAIQNAFALRVPVQCVEPGALPRFEAKARRWVRRDDQTS